LLRHAAAARPRRQAVATAPGESAAATPAAELEGKITFLHKYSDPRYAPYFEQVVAAYMAENPKVEIEIQAESDQGVKDKLRILAASNKLPDVYFSWAGDFTKKFVRGDLAKDLTGDVTGEWKDSFTPAALEAYTAGSDIVAIGRPTWSRCPRRPTSPGAAAAPGRADRPRRYGRAPAARPW
jgi:ABC-type glycerol-3-phosphate transport system substrate-binding protein